MSQDNGWAPPPEVLAMPEGQALYELAKDARRLGNAGGSLSSARGRVLLAPDGARVPLLLQGLDTYELTGKPRTPAYARVVDMGLANPYTGETLCKIGDTVFLDLATVIAEVRHASQKCWVAKLEDLIAVINEPRGKPVPLNDYFLTEEDPAEMVRQYAPTLAEANPDFRFDADTNRNGLASDAKSGSKNRKVFTYKYERVSALGHG
jgi:hypothetical protein